MADFATPCTARPLNSDERIVIKRVLGRGGFACCYEAKWTLGASPERRVGLKVLLPAHSSPACLYWSHFVQEAAFLRTASHKNVVRCFGLVQLPAGHPGLRDVYDGPTLAMLLEFVPNGTVAGLVQQQLSSPHHKVYSMSQAFSMARGIASSLAYLHQLSPPVVHRDLKLENMLLKTDAKHMTVKTADYGLHTRLETSKQDTSPKQCGARSLPMPSLPPALGGDDSAYLYGQSGQAERPCATLWAPSWCDQWALGREGLQHLVAPGVNSLSASGMAAHETQAASPGAPKPHMDDVQDPSYCLTGETGSPIYMAPEVFLCRPYNAKADVFSFGIMMYEIFGRTLLIFTHLGQGRGRFATSEDFARQVSCGWRPSQPDSIPDPLWELIESCWAADPALRPGMGQVLQELEVMQARLVPGKRASQAGGKDGGGGSGLLEGSPSWTRKLASLFQ